MPAPKSEVLRQKADELREQAKQIAAEARREKRREERAAARREREQLQRDAVALMEHAQQVMMNVDGKPMSVYEFLVADYERAKQAEAADERVREEQSREQGDEPVSDAGQA